MTKPDSIVGEGGVKDGGVSGVGEGVGSEPAKRVVKKRRPPMEYPARTTRVVEGGGNGAREVRPKRIPEDASWDPGGVHSVKTERVTEGVGLVEEGRANFFKVHDIPANPNVINNARKSKATLNIRQSSIGRVAGRDVVELVADAKNDSCLDSCAAADITFGGLVEDRLEVRDFVALRAILREEPRTAPPCPSSEPSSSAKGHKVNCKVGSRICGCPNGALVLSNECARLVARHQAQSLSGRRHLRICSYPHILRATGRSQRDSA